MKMEDASKDGKKLPVESTIHQLCILQLLREKSELLPVTESRMVCCRATPTCVAEAPITSTSVAAAGWANWVKLLRLDLAKEKEEDILGVYIRRVVPVPPPCRELVSSSSMLAAAGMKCL